MKLHPRLSRAAVTLASRFETFHETAQPAAAGGWTIGYGHTRSAREGARVTRSDAEALLLFDLSQAADVVAASLYAPASPRQFEALTAFCFNIGAENFRTSSALACFNAGQELDAADEIERWRAAELGAGTQVVDALVRRRAAEKAHFLGLPEGFSKSPSAVLLPVAVEAGHLPPCAEPADGGEVSATRQAADDIQARLRALVPEQPPAEADDLAAEVQAPPFPEPDEPTPPPAPPVPPEETPQRIEPVTSPVNLYARGGAPAEAPANDLHVAEPPSPLPPPPPPPSEPPPPTPLPPAPIASPERLEPAAHAGATAPRLRPPMRTLYLLLAGLGAAMFTAAVVLILGGRPTLPSLIVGMLGAMILTPGVYGLLGPRID